MSTTLACVACSLDPQTTSLILPLAQATILAAPVILRKEIASRARAIRTRKSRRASTADKPPTPWSGARDFTPR